MNNDLISREALKEEISSWGMNDYEPADFIDAIDNAPTVESEDNAIQYTKGYQDGFLEGKKLAERPQGEWITKHKENSFGQDVVCFECNKCGEYKLPIIHTMITEPLGVCPNCGVNMRKGGADTRKGESE